MPALTTIGKRAFYRTPLAQLGVHGDMANLTEIGEGAFEENTRLTRLGDMRSLTTIGPRAFYGTPLTNLGDMRSLTIIGRSAFENTRLTQLGDMQSLEQIEGRAFHRTQLTQLGDMSSLTTIGYEAFLRTKLKNLVNMPELRTISRRAFGGCTNLETVHLPMALRHVGVDAFNGCPLGQLSVEPGAEFVCECTSLASRLRALDNVHVEYLRTGVRISTV